MKRGHEKKTELTPDEKLRVVMGHEIYGIEQHALAALFAVNPGRIAEAVTNVRVAIGAAQPKENHQ